MLQIYILRGIFFQVVQLCNVLWYIFIDQFWDQIYIYHVCIWQGGVEIYRQKERDRRKRMTERRARRQICADFATWQDVVISVSQCKFTAARLKSIRPSPHAGPIIYGFSFLWLSSFSKWIRPTFIDTRVYSKLDATIYPELSVQMFF